MKNKIDMKTRIVSIIMIALVTLGIQAQIDRTKQPVAGPAPTINLASPDSFTLKNGLKVLLVQNKKLPRVTASLILDNAPHAENEKAGIGALTSAVLGNGTKNMAKEAYLEEIDFLGANLNISAENAFASSLSKYFPRVMELMADGALNPLFTEEDFEAEKVKLIEGIKSGEKSVSNIAGQVSRYLAYGAQHPYGEFATEETINNITFADVKDYYQRYFVPGNAYLVMVGDINYNDAKNLVEKNFNGWAKSKAFSKTTVEPINAQYTQINFIDMPNAVQSELVLQNTVDLEMKDDDYFSALVANQILGGSFGSYLNMNLREANGYTYGARSSIGADPYASRFQASASVRNEVTDSAVVEAMKEIRRIRTEKVSPKDLKNTKNKYAGNFVLQLENPATIANYALNIERYGLPKDFYKNYLKNINAVTAEDVMAAANKYFKTDQMRIVVAGKGMDAAEPLEAISFDGKKVPVFYFDKEGNKVEKPVYSKPLPDNVTAQSVVNTYIDALGGKDKLNDVKSISIMADVTIEGAPFKPTAVIKTMAPNMSSMEMNIEGMGTIMKQKFDGATGYAMQQGQRRDMSAEEIAKEKAKKGLFEELYFTANDITLETVATVNEKDAYKVKVTEGDDVSYRYYDTETGYLVQTESTTEAGGQKITTIRSLSDYRDVGGVKIPFVQKIAAGPQIITMTASDVKVNADVTEADFK